MSVVGSAVLAGSVMFTAGGIGNEPQRLGLHPLATLVANHTDTTNGIVSIEVDHAAATRIGSGMVLDDGIHVVTVLQLVSPRRADTAAGTSPELRVIDGRGVAHRATVVARDKLSDLAIIRTDGATMAPWARTPNAALTSGAVVTALGGGRGVGLRGWSNQVAEPDTAQRGDQFELVGVATLARPMPAAAAGALAVDSAGAFAGLVSVDLRDGSATAAVDLTAVIVPAERLFRAVEQFLATGTIAHGWLGVEAPPPVDATRLVAQRLGAAVEDVVAGSPAGVAGVRAGDVLVRVCGHAVATIDDVLSQMLLTEPGARCALDLLRDGQAWQAEAVIGTRAAP